MELLTRLEPLRGSFLGDTLSWGRLPLVATPGYWMHPLRGRQCITIDKHYRPKAALPPFRFLLTLLCE
jgi:hypothetical protein